MADPGEGVAPDGTIATGVDRDRVPVAYEPVLAAVCAACPRPEVSLYLYGSVANGTARPGVSDVDLLSLGLSADEAARISSDLSARFADVARAVEIGAGQLRDFDFDFDFAGDGDGDEAYGNRVFLRHYCLPLAGADLRPSLPRYPADARAARGFNGDLDRHLARWRATTLSPALARRVGRKTLLAVAGLVSVQDRDWTTDRTHAAQRWGQRHPQLTAGLDRLLTWSDGGIAPERELAAALERDGLLDVLTEQFAQRIGLWRD